MRQASLHSITVALSFASTALGIESRKTTERPNVLMIIVDDLNTQVGCFDGPAITPNIDALGHQGVKFTNAYSACPSCNPSRVSMFTGRRPEVTKLFSNSQEFREVPTAKSLTTLPQLLKAKGYNTISAGKIFHNRRGTKPEPSPLSDPISWTFQASIDAGLFFGPNFKEQFHEKDGSPRWVSRTRGKVDEEDRKKLKSTWVYGPIDVEPTNTLDFNTAEFGAAYLTGDTSHPQVAAAPSVNEKPFFLACGIFRPHIPILAPQEFFDLYTKEENTHRLRLPDLPADDLDDLPDSVRRGKHWYAKYLKPWPAEQRNLRHAYLAATSYADAAVGIILDGLRKSGLADNTIVILIGDHGYQLGEKDRLGKAAVWRGSSRTPMIVKVPGEVPGVSNEAVSLIDLYPTVLNLLGLDPIHQLDGQSLVPLLEDPSADREVPAVVTSAGSGKTLSVILDQWHYINHNDGAEELYDHSSDPGEITNLLHLSRSSEKYRAIAAKLEQFIPAERN